MKVIRPITITPSKVLSSNATEANPTWNAGTTYNLGDLVVYSNKIYESLIGANLNKQPDNNATAWLDRGASNKMRMFDLQVNTQTTAVTSLVVSFQPGIPFNSVAFLNVNGVSISISVKDSPTGSVVFTSSTNLDNSSVNVIDWYSYFFEDFDSISEAIFQNIPPYSSAVIEVTVTSAPGEISAIGACVVGNIAELGNTQYGLGYGIRDYSIKNTDEFGNTTFVQRSFSKRMTPKLDVDNNKLNYVSKILEGLRAIPTVYIATDDSRFLGGVVFGFLKDWNIEVNYPSYSMLSIEVDGLI